MYILAAFSLCGYNSAGRRVFLESSDSALFAANKRHATLNALIAKNGNCLLSIRPPRTSITVSRKICVNCITVQNRELRFDSSLIMHWFPGVTQTVKGICAFFEVRTPVCLACDEGIWTMMEYSTKPWIITPDIKRFFCKLGVKRIAIVETYHSRDVDAGAVRYLFNVG